jgi:hypothetical protein
MKRTPPNRFFSSRHLPLHDELATNPQNVYRLGRTKHIYPHQHQHNCKAQIEATPTSRPHTVPLPPTETSAKANLNMHQHPLLPLLRSRPASKPYPVPGMSSWQPFNQQEIKLLKPKRKACPSSAKAVGSDE